MAKEGPSPLFPMQWGRRKPTGIYVQYVKAGPKVPEVFAHRDGLQDCLQSPEEQGKWKESLGAGKVNIHRGALDPEQRGALGACCGTPRK